MKDPLQRIATLAGTMSSAALRVLLQLTANPKSTNSQRELVAATNMSRSNVQQGIEELIERELITSDRGTTRRGAHFSLPFLQTLDLPVPVGRGPKTGPPVDLNQVLSGLETGPPVDLNQVHSASSSGPATGPHPRARVDSEFDSIAVLDRLLRSSPKKFDDEQTRNGREWLYGYMRKFGRERDPHPPDAQIVAQFLSIAPWPRLEALLQQLFRENCAAGQTYAWFVAVALQRIHGINPAELRQRKAQLQEVKRPKPPAPGQQQLQPSEAEIDPDPVVQEALDLQRQIRAMAVAKGMR